MKKLFGKVRNNQFLREFFRFYKEADSELSSVAVAYYWLISVFPLLLIVVNIFALFSHSGDGFSDSHQGHAARDFI